jgi:hypothetical protein
MPDLRPEAAAARLRSFIWFMRPVPDEVFHRHCTCPLCDLDRLVKAADTQRERAASNAELASSRLAAIFRAERAK